MSRVLFVLMLVVPVVLTIYAVVGQRGPLRIAMLILAFFSGWFLICWQTTASLDEYNARAPAGSEACGMAAGLALIFGWMYSGAYVVAWSAVSLAGVGITKLAKFMYTKAMRRRLARPA